MISTLLEPPMLRYTAAPMPLLQTPPVLASLLSVRVTLVLPENVSRLLQVLPERVWPFQSTVKR